MFNLNIYQTLFLLFNLSLVSESPKKALLVTSPQKLPRPARRYAARSGFALGGIGMAGLKSRWGVVYSSRFIKLMIKTES